MPRFVCLIPLIAGAIIYGLFGHPTLPILDFQFAGDATDAAQTVAGRTGDFRDALRADWIAMIPGMALTLGLASWRHGDRRIAIAGVLFGLAAASCDIIENAYGWQGLNQGTDRAFELQSIFAAIKYALLVPAVGLAAWGLFRPTVRAQSVRETQDA